jgi:hypothetical protein
MAVLAVPVVPLVVVSFLARVVSLCGLGVVLGIRRGSA